MDVYERLTVFSGLIIFSALSVFVNARNTHPTAEEPAFATTNMLLSGSVIGANVYGTAVVLLQKVCINQCIPFSCVCVCVFVHMCTGVHIC